MSGSKKLLALMCLIMAQFMIVLDISILNVALPSIERSFHFSVNNLQWIITSYTLAFGGFLLFGGRAADLYGRKRVFMFSVAGFATVSLLLASIASAKWMIPLRTLQGLFAAFVSPSALSLVLTLFTDAHERNRALSFWGAVSAGGATVGLLLGGFLTEFINWRWNFLVNVPVGLLIVLLAWKVLPRHIEEEQDTTLDIWGAVLATSGLMIFVYACSKASYWGWLSLETFAVLTFSIFVLGVFVWHERRAKHPLMPLSIFKIGNVAAANFIRLPIAASLSSAFFFLTLYIQNILGYTPLEAGLAFLPMSLLIGFSAIFAPPIVERLGIRNTLIISPLFPALGLFLLGFVPVSGSYITHILPSLLIMPLGLGLSFVALSIAATYGVPPHESGLASGILTTGQQVGVSIGLAILSSVAAATTMHATGSHPAAMLAGFHVAYFLGSAFALVASVVAFLFIRKRAEIQPI